MPRVTIAIPMFNESQFIRDSVLSALNQGFQDVEVVVYDNASTDGSVEEIEGLPSLKVVRHPENIGALNNFKHAFLSSESEYFMWLGAHDVISVNYVENAVSFLHENSDFTAAFSQCYRIDAAGKLERELTESYYDFTQDNVVERYLYSVFSLVNCTCVHSLFRRDSLNNFTWPVAPACDKVMLSHILSTGKMAFLKDSAYYRRYFDNRTGINDSARMKRIAGSTTDVNLSYADLIKEYCNDFRRCFHSDYVGRELEIGALAIQAFLKKRYAAELK